MHTMSITMCVLDCFKSIKLEFKRKKFASLDYFFFEAFFAAAFFFAAIMQTMIYLNFQR